MKIIKAFWIVTIITLTLYFIGMFPLLTGGDKPLYPIWIPLSFTILQFVLLIAVIINYIIYLNKK